MRPRARARRPSAGSCCKFAAASGLLAAIERNVALAQSAPDYKALVCVNLAGGNDGENTLIRYDTAGYQNYATIRTAGFRHQHPAGAAPADPAGARRAAVRLPSGMRAAAGSLQPEEARGDRERRACWRSRRHGGAR